MSMFVEDSDSIEIKVHYACVGQKVELFDEPGDGRTTLSFVFRQPDFATSQRLVAASTIIDQNGSPSVNLIALQNNLVYFLAQSWDAKDKDGKPIELNNENIGRLRVEIARAVIGKLSVEVGQIM